MKKRSLIIWIVTGLCLINSPVSLADCSLADLSGDCRVDFEDFAILGDAWMSEVGDLNWDPACDISEPNDNIINALDHAVFVDNWLEGVPEDPNSMVWVYINDPGFNGYMSKYETTNAQYCQFLNAALSSGDITVSGSYVTGTTGPYSGQNYYYLAGTGYTFDGATNGGAARINWTGSLFTVDSGFENHPVTYVSWYGSAAFASYYGWRLPMDWEWRAVADYDGSYIYGCGTSINNNIANYLGSTHPYGTTVVGAFGTYGYGMCDMAGNVIEWTSSCYYEDCDPGHRILLGGRWDVYGSSCTVSHGTAIWPYGTRFSIGFRVCR